MISAIVFQVTLDMIVCIQLIIYRDKVKQIGNNITKKKKKKVGDINKLMKKIDDINILGGKKEHKEPTKIELKKNGSTDEVSPETNKKEQSDIFGQ